MGMGLGLGMEVRVKIRMVNGQRFASARELSEL